MITVRKSSERGRANLGWLDSRHTFSFGTYWDPRYQGFSDLLVINEDRVQPETGFGTHRHRDMEIISYVLEGQLAHKDSMGTGSIIRPGEVQRMSAGTGVAHSEMNPSSNEPVHFLQIWIVPATQGIEPSYEQKAIPFEEKHNRLRLIASHEGGNGAVQIHQDAKLYVTALDPGQSVSYDLPDGRNAWIQVARGAVRVNDTALEQGDGAAISDESRLTIMATEPAEILLFDLR